MFGFDVTYQNAVKIAAVETNAQLMDLAYPDIQKQYILQNKQKQTTL